ncbi:matrix Gla protein [Pseudoliparis swirei]|uniref:matrix Gla protein n=1 Tax=Pseudoliparis swirei TaxID=2059687 RepID=UPI0024BD7C10|nr:matrix Gla protein [Pseudoliparis swirei]
MRSLLQCLALCAAVSFCVGYDSDESTESIEDVFVPPSRANSFITRQRGSAYSPGRGAGHNYYYRFMRPMKSLMERRAETCEDYSPCRFFAYRHGSHQAYQRFFAARNRAQNPPQRPAAARRY